MAAVHRGHTGKALKTMRSGSFLEVSESTPSSDGFGLGRAMNGIGDLRTPMYQNYGMFMRLHAPTLSMADADYGVDNLCIIRHYNCRDLSKVADPKYGWHALTSANQPNNVYRGDMIDPAEQCITRPVVVGGGSPRCPGQDDATLKCIEKDGSEEVKEWPNKLPNGNNATRGRTLQNDQLYFDPNDKDEKGEPKERYAELPYWQEWDDQKNRMPHYQEETDLSKCKGYHKLKVGEGMCTHNNIKRMLESYGDASIKVYERSGMEIAAELKVGDCAQYTKGEAGGINDAEFSSEPFDACEEFEITFDKLFNQVNSYSTFFLLWRRGGTGGRGALVLFL